ncbi:MAG TPA: hypothetical protein VIJ01_13115 [Candidatus Angelobacter sp.]
MAVITLCSLALSAQAADDNKAKPASKETQANPASLSLPVDSARKTSDLPPAIDTDMNQGENWGGYEVKQSAEFGGRISDFTGSQAMWATFVNLGSGPRLLEYTLDMRSPGHTGKLFDDFSFSNFGYGGDPVNVSHLRLMKGALYTFSANFKRDQNIFDYDLFANPLNPTLSSPNAPILNSPHEFLLTRRMSDVNLSLFPVAKIRFKVGWSRVMNEGTSFSTVHQGTEGLLDQPTLNTSDNFNFGVSLRWIPKTAINFDQFFTHFKGDTSAFLAPAGVLSGFGVPATTLAGGIAVNLGLPFNTPAGQPCATPILATGFANPACNGFFGYNRQEKVRTNYPTEQLSYQSNYFKRVDLSGRFSYSSADSGNPVYNETFSGLITRNRQRFYQQAGSSNAQRISANADFGMTYRLTDKLHLIDAFRWDNFRIPTGWNYTTNSLYGATLLSNPNVFSPATCPAPFTAATCPQHLAGSPADTLVDVLNQFLKQDSRINTFEVEYAFTPRISAYVGYRFERRDITTANSGFQVETFFPTLASSRCASAATTAHTTCTAAPNGSFSFAGENPVLGDSNFVEINAHSALFGFSARPTNRIRFSFDTEQYYADNTFTRISPRHLQRYKGRVNAKITEWWNFGTAINIRENRNDTADVGNKQHNRSYAFNSVFAPADAKWGLDLSYDYNDIFSQTNICFVATPTPPGSLTCGTPFLSGLSVYSETAHTGAGSIYLKPIKRLTAAVGYTVTSSNGNTLIINPNAPTGPLAFNYHLPTASIAYQIEKNLSFKGGWNYYDYNEKSNPGPTLPRDFRGNTFTLALRYSM